jgi:hypothetical protein
MTTIISIHLKAVVSGFTQLLQYGGVLQGFSQWCNIFSHMGNGAQLGCQVAQR